MPIYISKKAANDIPLTESDFPIKLIDKKLKSDILNGNAYLNELASNPTVAALYLGSKSSDSNPDAIMRISMALIAISQLYDEEFDVIIQPTSIFDPQLDDAVRAFQMWTPTLEVNGQVNSDTLLTIDSKLGPDEYYDYQKEKYLGTETTPYFATATAYDESSNEYTLSFELQGKSFTIKASSPLNGAAIRGSDGNILFDGGQAYIKPTPESLNLVLFNEDVRNTIASSGKEFSDHGMQIALKMKIDNLVLDSPNLDGPSLLPLPETQALSQETSKMSSSRRDPNDTLYQIQNGDTVSSLVVLNYYEPGNFDIMNEYDNTIIFTLPSRVPLDQQYRNEDARFQFYINLLYYYNISGTEENVVESGFRAAPFYQRYDTDHLDSVNIFNNKFEAGDANTGLPNYYRFLKKMETLNPQSTIQFDQGETLSFTAEEGEYIRIPSRQFADSLYYHLNFRYDEMLDFEIDNSDPDLPNNKIAIYKTQSAIANVILQLTSTSIFDVLSEGFKTATEELYEETWDFFKKSYDFVRNSLAQYWPRGTGGLVGVNAGITWGYPIATDVAREDRIWRKMTDDDVFTIMYRNEGVVGIGVDLAVGYSVGLYSGKGKSRRGIGAKAGAGITSMVNFKVVYEYEFPIRPEETGLLSMCIAVFGGVVGTGLTKIVDYLYDLNLSPDQYLYKTTVSIENKTNAWAGVQVNTPKPTPKDSRNISAPRNNNLPATESKKNFLSADNLFNCLPNIGITGEIDISLGLEFSIEYKYDNMPLVPRLDARVPSKVTSEILFNFGIDINFGELGGFIQRLFLKSALPGSVMPFLNSILGNKLVGVVFIGERLCAVEDLTLSNVNISNIPLTTSVSANSRGGIVYDTPGSDNFKWTSYIKLGTSEENPESFCELGSLVNLKLNFTKVRELWDNPSLINLENTLSILHSIEFGQKIGTDYNGADKKYIDITGYYANSNSTEPKMKHDILKRVSDVNVKAALYIYVKVEIEVEPIIKMLKYYFKLLKYSQLNTPQNTVNFLFTLGQKRKGLLNYLRLQDSNIQNIADLSNLNQLGYNFYNKLFSEDLVDPTDVLSPHGLNLYLQETYPELDQDLDFLSVFLEIGVLLEKFAVYYISPHPEKQLTEFEIKLYGIHDIPSFLSYVAGNSNLYVALEGQIGGNFDGSVRLGAEATVRLAFGATASLIDHSVFFEDGKFTIKADPTDSYNFANQKLRELANEYVGSNFKSWIKNALIRH